jgi:hypothetical protein
MSALAAAEARIAIQRERARSVIYYARVGPLIKIGTTIDLSTRMRTLGVDCVLVTEPGTYELEHQRHREFARSKAPRGIEYFHETADLVEHIRRLQMVAAEQARTATAS